MGRLSGRHLALLLAGLLAWSAGAQASSAVPMPVIPKAKGAHCVRPTGWMRRNHMRLLFKVRDEVVHQGIRPPNETLPACLSCHVSRLPNGHYPSATSPHFFCNSCHLYAGVRTSCFSCHSNRPASNEAALSMPPGGVSATGAGEQGASLATTGGVREH